MTKKAKPNPENRRNSRIGSETYPSSPNPEFPPNTESLIPEPRVARGIVKTNSAVIEKDSYSPLQSKKSVLPYPSSPDALRLVDALAFVGPDEENSETILEVGRTAWRSYKHGEITANDAAAVRCHLEDAARRAWLDHRPEIQKMLAANWPAHNDRLPWEIEER